MTISIKRSKRVWKDHWDILPKCIIEQMIRNQVTVEINGRLGGPNEILCRWCNENCEGLFRYSDGIYYFEEESDMLAFKLSWDGSKEHE